MERTTSLDIKLNNTQPDRKIFHVRFRDEQIADWCLSLSLLKYHLIDALSIIDNRETKLKIIMDAKINKKVANVRGRVFDNSDIVELCITPDELDYWLTFFLQYYRDGVTEVDHIDLDITTASKTRQNVYFYLTFTVPSAKPKIPWDDQNNIRDLLR